MDSIQVRPLHFGMSVSDIEAAIDWFGRALGFELVQRDDFIPGVKIAFIKNGDFAIELFEHAESQPASPERGVPNEDIRTQGNKHMCFGVVDLVALLDHLRASDVTIVMGPNKVPDGSLMAFIHGPDGALIELIQQP